MTLSPEQRETMVMLRLEKAKKSLQEAKDVATLNHWHLSANRLYYACYYAVSALLIKHGHSARTHSGVISLLSLHFVSKGLISKEQGKFYGNLFELRQAGDYDEWVTIEAKHVLPRIEPAEQFISAIENLTSAS